jgi:hypothetical protein
MTIPSGPQPPIGEVGIGQIYVRASDKTMWFGVPASEDPSQSLLIGDIAGLITEDSDTLTSAKSYTDTVATGLAPLHHTHVIDDVTGLQAALDANKNALPQGCIVLWSGTLATVPGGWAVCNGQNGTPDLRDKFIMGGGGVNAALATGGASSATNVATSNAGSFTPAGTVGGTAISVAQMPSHAHPGGTTDAQGAHTHNVIGRNLANSYAGPGAQLNVMGYEAYQNITYTDSQGNHQHNLNVAAQGGGATHTHTLAMNAVGGHTHTVTVPTVPPYIVLGYIMKV